MKNITNLIIKFIVLGVILVLLLPQFGRTTWIQTIITAVVLTIIAYVVGDMWVLPKFGNMAAIVVDFAVAALILWLMSRFLPQFIISKTGVWITALVIAIAEVLLHYYLLATQTAGKKAG